MIGYRHSAETTRDYVEQYTIAPALFQATIRLDWLSRLQESPGEIAGNNIVPVDLPTATKFGRELLPKTFFLMYGHLRHQCQILR
jgi:hypothetical protein